MNIYFCSLQSGCHVNKPVLAVDPECTGSCNKYIGESYYPIFEGTCFKFHGEYYPTVLQWSYHHTYFGYKTVFYQGPLPSISFNLPSGLDSTDFTVYLTVKAVDGKGVTKAHKPMSVTVYPKHLTGDGVVTVFYAISRMEPNIPSLELQTVRSLAWELNRIESKIVSQTVFDNVVGILFYRQSCKYVMESVPADDSQIFHDKIFYKFNLLKSCARDHLAEIACDSAIRSEMEILQKLSALSIVLDAPEFISSKTFFGVVEALWEMERQHLVIWDYRSELRSEVSRLLLCIVSLLPATMSGDVILFILCI